MNREIYRYSFHAEVPVEDVQASLVLALFGVESLHGLVQTRLSARHVFDARTRTCVIDASTPVGRDFNKLLVGFLSREFGPDCFEIQRVGDAGLTPVA